jgi:hypothetical protein
MWKPNRILINDHITSMFGEHSVGIYGLAYALKMTTNEIADRFHVSEGFGLPPAKFVMLEQLDKAGIHYTILEPEE